MKIPRLFVQKIVLLCISECIIQVINRVFYVGMVGSGLTLGLGLDMILRS